MQMEINNSSKDSVRLREYLHARYGVRKNLKPAIDMMAEGCLVHRYTVMNWMNGQCRIPELHKRKIEEIFGEKIFIDLQNA